MTQTFKIKLAAIAKDEAYYLPLWVYHHLQVGFDVLDIRVNDTSDNSLAILKKLKAIYGERLRFSVEDEILAQCQSTHSSFQAHIYQQVYQETLKEDFTHLMFLDIDEYWCAANFKSTIQDFLAQDFTFDIAMFQWLLDMPDLNRKMDDFPFKPQIQVQKDPHVKSLINLQAQIAYVDIHTCALKKGDYVLENGTKVPLAEGAKSISILPEAIAMQRRDQLNEYFIYHLSLRSQLEYLAGLMRGNKQVGDDSPIKTNRFGYLALHPNQAPLTWTLDEPILANYQAGYEQLAAALTDDLVLAQAFIFERKDAALNYIKQSFLLGMIYNRQMRGISAEYYERRTHPYTIHATITALHFDEQALICSFRAEVHDQNCDYELVITQNFSELPIPAAINLLDQQQTAQGSMQNYQIQIRLQDLVYLVYKRWPPFCLAARIGSDLVLLERGAFQEIMPVLAPALAKLRREAAKKPSLLSRLLKPS